MIEIHNARINTAGAYVRVNGLYPFALGSRPHNGRIPVIRLGGHREEHETGWQCAAREAREEANLHIEPLVPRATYLADGERIEAGVEKIQWRHATDQAPVPLLVVAYRREGGVLLSLMYLAQADGPLTPSSEIKGLLLLKVRDIHRMCREPMTLSEYMNTGGQAILSAEFDASLALLPFAQLGLLSMILNDTDTLD